MKRISFIAFALLLANGISMAQITLDNCSVEHKDSCWYVTFDYAIDKIPSRDGMLLITHLCNPDTCISSIARHFQGKKYAERYAKRHGYMPNLHDHGSDQCVIALPEQYASDTLWGITYSEYNNNNHVSYTLDTTEIVLPCCPTLSCHKVDAALTMADHIAQEHHFVKNIRDYTPLEEKSEPSPDCKQIVRYRTASPMLDTDYMRNAQSVNELMNIINQILADSSTTVEAVQLVGNTSFEKGENGNKHLGYQRAIALRNHIRDKHNLPDSIFEIADGGKNWQLIYSDIAMLDTPDGDSLINRLKSEPSPTRREIILRTYDGGEIYKELSRTAFAKQRGTSVNAIYYHNHADSVAMAINDIVNELINNPHPDYHKLAHQLHKYKDDARAVNLQGVIDYRRHRLHAAETAFEQAAAMGDEQAATNLLLVQQERESKDL